MAFFDFFKKKQASTEKANSISQEKRESFKVSLLQDNVVPIEKRVLGQSPSCDGLFPHEILVLSYATTFYVGKNTFQGFWWSKYGISDVQSILNSLAMRGYIKIGSCVDAISIEKQSVIKEELQKYKLKTTGNKTELIGRLVENVPETKLDKDFPKRPYALSETGEKTLKLYEWIPYIHHHSIEDLDIWNLTELIQTPPFKKYQDKVWEYVSNKGQEYALHGNFGLYRNSRFAMSEFVADTGKDELAFQLLCEVVAYDLSGLPNNFNINHFSIYAESFFPYERSVAKLAPGVTARIKKYAQRTGLTDEELRCKVVSEIRKLKLVFSLFSAEECGDIVLAEIHEDGNTLHKIYNKAKKHFEAFQ